MAKDAKENKGQMSRTITSLSFRTGKSSPDNDLIAEVNEFANLEENQGIAPTSLLRNFFTKKLREYNRAVKSDSKLRPTG